MAKKKSEIDKKAEKLANNESITTPDGLHAVSDGIVLRTFITVDDAIYASPLKMPLNKKNPITKKTKKK